MGAECPPPSLALTLGLRCFVRLRRRAQRALERLVAAFLRIFFTEFVLIFFGV